MPDSVSLQEAGILGNPVQSELGGGDGRRVPHLRGRVPGAGGALGREMLGGLFCIAQTPRFLGHPDNGRIPEVWQEDPPQHSAGIRMPVP